MVWFEELESRVLPNTTPHLLSSGAFTQNWSNTGLITSNDNWNNVPSIVGYRGVDLTSTLGVDPQTVLADETTVDVIANHNNPNTLTSGGVAEFELPDPIVALQGDNLTSNPFLVIYLNSTGVMSITVTYNLKDIDGSVDDSVQQVALQYRVGNTGDFTNIPTGYVADATTGPSLATLVTPVSAVLPALADDQSELQIRIITTNANGIDEWVGVDDIIITGTAIPSNLAPAITLPGGEVSYTENDPATILDAGATVSDPDSTDFDTGSLTVDITANGTAEDRIEIRNQGTGSGEIGVTGSVVSFEGTEIGSINAGGGIGTAALTITFNANATPSRVQALVRNLTFRSLSESPSSNPRTIRLVISDGDGGISAEVTRTVTVVPVNDAPVLAGVNELAGIVEDASSNPGTLVTELVAGQVTDPDGPAVGIAVTAVDDSSGSWEFATDGMTFTQIAGQLSGGKVLLLASDPDTRVRFVPHADFHGSVNGVTFRAWDRSDGATEGSSVDPATLAGGSSLSSLTATAAVVVSPVADRPSVTTAVTNEDTQTTSGLVVTRNPADGIEVTHFRITAITGGVLFKSDGISRIDDGQFLTFAEANAGLKFTPAPDANTPAGGTFSFDIQASLTESIGGLGGGIATATVTVNPVNDPPVIGSTGGTVSYTEGNAGALLAPLATVTDIDTTAFDSGILTVEFVTGGAAGDLLLVFDTGTVTSGGSVVSVGGTPVGTISGGVGGVEPLVVTFNASATLATVESVLRAIGYTTSSDDPGSAIRTIHFTLSDGASGTSNQPSVLVVVTPVNDAPTLVGANDVIGIIEDPLSNPGTLVAALISGQFSDLDGPGAGIAVTAINDANGTWEYAVDGTTFAPVSGHLSGGNLLLLAGDSDTRVRFVPDPNFFGTVSGITFRAWDGADGIVEGVSVDPAILIAATSLSDTTATTSISIDPVNDPPILSAFGGVVSYDAGSAPRQIGSEAVVTDIDSLDFDAGALTIGIVSGRQVGDEIEILNRGAGPGEIGVSGTSVSFGGTVIGSFTGGTGSADLVITLNTNATPLAVESLIRNITFFTPEAGAISGERTVQFQLADGDGGTSGTPLVIVMVNGPVDVESITRTGSSITNSDVVSWAVTLAGGLGGLTAGNFQLTGALAIGSSITSVTGGANTWIVTATIGGTEDGTIGLDLVNDTGLTPLLANEPVSGDTYTIDRTSPGVTDVADGDEDGVVPVGMAQYYIVSFSESVDPASVTADDFANAGTAAISVGPIVQTSHDTLTVAVTPTSGGTLQLLVGPSIVDLAGNPMDVVASDADTLTADEAPPVVTALDDGDADDLVKANLPLLYTITFSEPLDGATVSGQDFANSGTATISIGEINQPSLDTLTVAITPTSAGTLVLQVGPGITDVAGNPMTSAVTHATTVIVDSVSPMVLSIDDGDPDDLVPAGSLLTYTVKFTEPIDFASVSVDDFTNAGTATVSVDSLALIDPDIISVRLTPGTSGTLALAIQGGVSDIAGNTLAVPVTDDTIVTVDSEPLVVAEIDDGDGDDVVTPNVTLTYTIRFAEPINFSSVSATDFGNAVHPTSGGAEVIIGTITSITIDTITVQITPTTVGSVQLQIGPGVSDVAGNSMGNVATDTEVVISNLPPVPADDAFTTSEDVPFAALAGGVLTNDTDPNDSTAVLVIDTAPVVNTAHGDLTLFPDGTFKYIPDPHFNGIDTFVYRVIDPHGDDAVAIVTMIVTPVNDEPSFNLATTEVPTGEDTGLQSLPGFTTNITTGPSNESGQVLLGFSLTVTNTTGNLSFSSPPTIDLATGSLTFASAPDTNGTATVEVVLTDGGSGITPNINASSRTFTIVVAAVNDAPSFQIPGSVPIVSANAGPQSIIGFVTDFQPGPATASDEAIQTPTYIATVTGTTGGLTFDISPMIMPDGTLTYTVSPRSSGTATVTVRVRDDGGVNGGGQDTSVERTFTIFVDPATVPPSSPLPPASPPPPVGPVAPTLAVGGLPNGTVTVYVPGGSGQFSGHPLAILTPFGGVATSLRTAVGDVNGDSIPDTVLITGPGTPVRVTVVSGADHATILVSPFDPFGDNFLGGGFVAVADIDGDARAEIVATPDQGGGPRVSIFSAVGGGVVERQSLLGIDDANFRGGARVALGDMNHDGTPDLVVTAGFLGGPRAAIFNGNTLFGTPARLVNDFFAFPGEDATRLRNGAYVAVGDVSGDGFADLIFGGGPGGAPRMLILSGAFIATGDIAAAQASPIANFFVAGNDVERGGVRVTAVDVDGDRLADVATGSGEGSVANVRVYRGSSFSGAGEPTTFQDLTVFGGVALTDGVFVG